MDYKSQAERQLYAEGFDKYRLSDIAGISVSGSDGRAKMSAFLRTAGNPYLFRVGDIGVHVVFSGKNGDALQDRLCHLLLKSV